MHAHTPASSTVTTTLFLDAALYFLHNPCKRGENVDTDIGADDTSFPFYRIKIKPPIKGERSRRPSGLGLPVDDASDDGFTGFYFKSLCASPTSLFTPFFFSATKLKINISTTITWANKFH